MMLGIVVVVKTSAVKDPMFTQSSIAATLKPI